MTATRKTAPGKSGARKAPDKAPRHFATAKAFGAWLDRHHDTRSELWVGFWKKGSGKPSIDWPQAVDSGYSIKARPDQMPAEQERRLRGNRAAWVFWQAQPPGYRRRAVHWVTSAKRDETRERRLAQLIPDSAAGRRIGALTSPTPRR